MAGIYIRGPDVLIRSLSSCSQRVSSFKSGDDPGRGNGSSKWGTAKICECTDGDEKEETGAKCCPFDAFVEHNLSFVALIRLYDVETFREDATALDAALDKGRLYGVHHHAWATDVITTMAVVFRHIFVQ